MRIFATLEIRADIEAETAEEALKQAIATGNYKVIRSTLQDKPVGDYISIAEYARQAGYSDSTYPRRLAERGKLPGAVKIGNGWCVPAGTPRVDRRVSSGRYVGSEWHRDYRKRKRSEAQTDSASDTEE